MNKGDIVNCRAEVFTSYAHNWHIDEKIHVPETNKSSGTKALFRRSWKKSFRCVLLGKTYIATGHLYIMSNDYEYEPNYLVEDKRHTVWVCEPYNNSNRYYKTFYALEEDLSPIE